MSPNTTVEVIGGPYVLQVGMRGHVAPHTPARLIPVNVRVSGEARVLWLEKGEVRAA